MALPQHPGLAQQMAAMQQQMQGGHAPGAGEGTDSAAIQALLAQAGLLTQGGGAVGMGAHAGVPTSAPGSAVGLASPGAGSAARGPGSALSTGALSTGTASPTHSLSAPMPTPLFNGGGSLGGGQGPPSARGAGSYLGTSPTATHSSAGDTGERWLVITEYVGRRGMAGSWAGRCRGSGRELVHHWGSSGVVEQAMVWCAGNIAVMQPQALRSQALPQKGYFPRLPPLSLPTPPTQVLSSCPPCAGSGRTSPAAPLAAANPALVTRRPGSDTGSPLGRYGAVGSPSSQGAASSGIGAAAEEALVARMGGLTTRDLGVPTATSVQVCWMSRFWLAGQGRRGVGSSWACCAVQGCAACDIEGSLQAARVPGPAPPPCSPVLAPMHPSTPQVAEQGPGAGMLPPGWAQVTDGQGLVYYVNHVTQEVKRERCCRWRQACLLCWLPEGWGG